VVSGDAETLSERLVWRTSRPVIVADIDICIESSDAFLKGGAPQVDDPDFDISNPTLTSLWKIGVRDSPGFAPNGAYMGSTFTLLSRSSTNWRASATKDW
jgi:hypothetical protein